MCIVFVLNISVSRLKAQGIKPEYIKTYDSDDHLYTFKNNIYTNDLDFKPDCFILADEVVLVMDKSGMDASGNTHRRYHQTYGGVPVINSEFLVHTDADYVSKTGSGNLLTDIKVHNAVAINAEQAMDYAISMDGAALYAWQDAEWESMLQNMKNDAAATYFPSPKLVVIDVNSMQPLLGVKYKYAYQVDLLSLSPGDHNIYYIDASNGSLILKNNVISTCSKHAAGHKPAESRTTSRAKQAFMPPPCALSTCDPGNAITYYYGMQSFNLYRPSNLTNSCTWYLQDNCVPGVSTNVTADNAALPTQYLGNSGFNWGTTQREATSALFAAEVALDYYYSVHGRNSYDDQGSGIFISVKDNSFTTPGTGNASWPSPGVVLVSDVLPPFTSEISSIDVIGHEISHGVSNPGFGALITNMETASIAEALPDIMATMIDHRWKDLNGLSYDWMIAEECVSGGLRNMANPNQFNHPDTYQGTFWNPLSPDAHALGGVVNHWYYLLCMGGTGTNDISNSYCVKGISRMHAEAIVYHFIKFYLAPNESLSSMRAKTLQSAIDLYGTPNLDFVAQVASAWHAVGVGPVFTGTINLNSGAIPAGATKTWAYNNPVNTDILTINPTATVVLTSGDQIWIDGGSGSHIQTGANFHAYITPGCAGGARMASEPAGNGTGVNNAAFIDGDKLFDFAIIPNPNNGEFKVTLSSASQLPGSIAVIDVMGRVVRQIHQPDSYEIDFSMQEQAAGIYLIKADYGSSVSVKRIVKK